MAIFHIGPPFLMCMHFCKTMHYFEHFTSESQLLTLDFRQKRSVAKVNDPTLRHGLEYLNLQETLAPCACSVCVAKVPKSFLNISFHSLRLQIFGQR